jgi:regulator of chromosome condensation
MPPKAASKKAAASAPKKAAAGVTKKTTTTTKKTAAAPAKAAAAKPAAKATKAAAKPTVNGTTTASKKRKADDSNEDEDKENISKTKKSKTAVTKEASKKAAPKKAAPKKAAPAAKPTAAPKKAAAPAKRKTDEESEDEESEEEVAPKKAAPKTKAAPRARTPAPRAPPKHPHTIGAKINDAPTKRLDIYVFGEGTSGELGLGSKRVDNKKPIDVKRPRLNTNLDAATVGVVQISAGGMHVAALTHDNKILTWGVNDQGALGRDTQWDGGLRDVDAGSDSGSDDEDDDTGMNPIESTPAAVSAEHFAPGTKFVQVVTADSATFALTEDGRVYGWGTFRVREPIPPWSHQVLTFPPVQRWHPRLQRQGSGTEVPCLPQRPEEHQVPRRRLQPHSRPRHQGQHPGLGLRPAEPAGPPHH